MFKTMNKRLKTLFNLKFNKTPHKTDSDNDTQTAKDVNYFVIPFANDQSNILISNLNKINIRLSYRNII